MDRVHIGKKNNTRTVQAESSKFASLSIDQGFQIVIRPRNKKMMQKAPSNGTENVVLHPNV